MSLGELVTEEVGGGSDEFGGCREGIGIIAIYNGLFGVRLKDLSRVTIGQVSTFL